MAGKKWSGPREGINWAGYAAWAVGFVIGALNIPVRGFTLANALHIPYVVVSVDRPAVLWSFVVGFVVYMLLKGIRPPVIPLDSK